MVNIFSSISWFRLFEKFPTKNTQNKLILVKYQIFIVSNVGWSHQTNKFFFVTHEEKVKKVWQWCFVRPPTSPLSPFVQDELIVQMSNSSKTKINSHTKNWSVSNIFIWFQEEEKRKILEIRSSVYTTDIRLSKLLRPRNLFVRFARKSWNNKTFSYQYFFYRFNETRKTLIKGWSPRQVRSYFI